MQRLFQEKSVVVTGAASGIGYALSLALWRRGASVYASDINAEGLRRLDQTSSGDINSYVLDVTDEAAVADLLARVACEHGRLDYLFNNAGIVVGGDFEAMDMASWRKIVDINLWSVIYGSQLGYAQMRKQGHGHIINTASTAGVTPVAKSTAYACTKHAVVGLSTSLREEARPHGIRVSVVLPGLVDTAIFRNATNLKGHDYAAEIGKLPIKKISPQQAANAILRGVAKNQQYIVFPFYNKLIIRLYRLLPGLTGWLINRDL